jgi:hypothetical protein
MLQEDPQSDRLGLLRRCAGLRQLGKWSAHARSRRVHTTNQALRRGIPAIYGQREFADVGGLMSYGTNLADTWHQVGIYTGRILKGVKPAGVSCQILPKS